MKHHNFDQLRTLAKIDQDYPQLMSRRKRLQRWIELLEADPSRVLSTLHETEYLPQAKRDALRCDNSVISIAFSDPILRASGMQSDTYGEAKRFFELSDRQLHRIVCDCHFGAIVSTAKVARFIRVKHVESGNGFWACLRAIFA